MMRSLKLACTVIVCVAGCDAKRYSPTPLTTTGTIDVYAVSASQVPGARKATDPESKASIFLVTPAIISTADVATVQRTKGSPESLTVNLTPAGASKLAAATSKLAGMQVAFVVNGTVVSAPKVMSPLSSGFRITSDVIAKNSEQIFAALTGK